jgi:hypothetical protein
MPISKKKLYILVGAVAIVVVVGLILSRYTGNNIEITNDHNNSQISIPSGKSQLSGVTCETYNSRPFAVMVSSDAEARPLSGIGEADMVFEMPVVPNGFTRMMAVFQCDRPKEVGSIRSSRLDFVPLALGMNAIYAHFGGEHEVLAQLNDGIINNIDGLKYDGTIYYRKPEIPKPHNAFTDFDLLTKISKDLNYSLTDGKVSYSHEDNSFSQGNVNPQPIYATGFQVDWKYNKDTNSYFRTRSGKSEIDKNTGKQVETKNVVVMKTTWSPISKDYIRVKVIGSGGLLLYKDGIVITGTWEKKDNNAKLTFYDQNHKEIPLAIGSTWVEITTTN